VGRLDALRLRPGVCEPARRTRQARRLTAEDRRGAALRPAPAGHDRARTGPDRLYLGSGTTCDVCKEKDRRSGAVLSFRLDGSDLRVVATGLRNPFGLVFDGPVLYVSDNARDDLGENEPAETIVRIRHGAHYGWPRCWASWRLRKLQGSCRGVTPPVAYLEPHSSANSLALWGGTLIVAEWGQYLSERRGRKLVQVNVRTGRSSTFADGFEHPLGLVAEPRNGGLLAGDWGRGVIYRIRKR
jgi:glucose/arabinose dehydrogenase